jgi:hypothetical protein
MDRLAIWGGRSFNLLLGEEILVIAVYSCKLVIRFFLLPDECLLGLS